MTNRTGAGRVSAPRLAAAVLLHVSAPAYLLACLVACLAPPVSNWAAVPGRMLWTGAWYLPLFAGLMLVTALLPALVDRRIPALENAEIDARTSLPTAVRTLMTLGDRRLERAALAAESVGWNFADERDRRVIADLEAAARTFAAAAASAPSERRPMVLSLAAESIERLAAAGQGLAAERGALDEGDARTVAGYVAARYPD